MTFLTSRSRFELTVATPAQLYLGIGEELHTNLSEIGKKEKRIAEASFITITIYVQNYNDRNHYSYVHIIRSILKKIKNGLL